MANPIKMDDLGGSTIFGNSHLLGMTSYPPCLGIMFFRKNIRIPIKLNNQFFWKVRPGVLFFVAHVYICMCVPVRVCIHIYIYIRLPAGQASSCSWCLVSGARIMHPLVPVFSAPAFIEVLVFGS